MSLYNAIFGVNPMAGVLLHMAGLDRADVGRFRDAYVTERDGEPVIAVYTRNGGGNREHWNDETDEGRGCDCTGCTQTYRLPGLPGYLGDEDDEFDCTYCTNYFKPQEGWEGLLAGLVREGDPNADWQEFLAAINNPPEEATTRPQKLALSLIESFGSGKEEK
jgi:hypothetical protein